MSFSSNEKEFFTDLLLKYDIRVDGREKNEIRKHQITQNIISTCFSSLKINYNNLNNEIIFAVKGEIVKENEVKMIENEKFLDLINININSMSSKVSMIETKIINKMKILLNKLMISKIDTSLLYIENSNPKLYWKIYMDVFWDLSIHINV